MNSSSDNDDFFASGIFYLKNTLLSLAEPAIKQKVGLSKYGFLEEHRDEISAAEILFQNEKISDEMRLKLKALQFQIEKACENFLAAKKIWVKQNLRQKNGVRFERLPKICLSHYLEPRSL
jgi:hypothetical protein